MIDKQALSTLIKGQALGMGFDLAGIATLGPADTRGAFEDWLERGYAGEMDYLPRGAEKRRDTRLPFPGAASAIVVALDYGGTSPSGPIARYARGDDYHDVMWKKLDSLHEWIDASSADPVRGKSYVDTGPILERDLARQRRTRLVRKEHESHQSARSARSSSSARCSSISSSSPTRRSRPIVAARARAASTRARRRRSSAASARRDAVHLVSHDRIARRDSRRASRADRDARSTAATSARTCARGT